jgi:hypothetical protein
MNNSMERVRARSWGRRARVAVLLGVSIGSLSACENLLEVNLPAQLGVAALEDPAGADTQLNSVITHFENSYSQFMWDAFGREDGGEIFSNIGGADFFEYFSAPTTRPDPDWFSRFSVGRLFATGFHKLLTDDWTAAEVPDRSKYLAIATVYEAAMLGIMGQFMCEVSIDSGPKMTPAQVYALAQTKLDLALSEIATAGDFPMPLGVASSATTMVHGLRAQVRWMAGDNAGAIADANKVPNGFTAWVTREANPARRNKAWWDGTNVQAAGLFDINTWWAGPNPITGSPWPSPIPFTGYIALGILPDGRAVRADGLPIRTAEASGTHRTAVEDTAVPDTRVRTMAGMIQGVGAGYVNHRFDDGGSDMPLVDWKEMILIRAELAGGQDAIDLVNVLRTDAGLPLVTYADPSDATEIKYMIIEERRRALFLGGGRYFAMKLRNPDILWFPRGLGVTRWAGNTIGGGVRWNMPDDEYILNENLTMDDRSTGCDSSVAPDPSMG